jgi:pyruvate kinase
MVARGDLGMELPPAKLTLAQKWMIGLSNLAGKFVINATQMLESMITAPYPTRAEISDVANAVFDGADAVMLSGETASGAHPEEACSVMASIARHAEMGTNFNQQFDFVRNFSPPATPEEAVAAAFVKNAVDIRPGMLVVFSETGKLARLAAKYRPCAPVLVVTSSPELARRCSGYFALYVMLLPKTLANRAAIFDALQGALRFGVEQGICVPGKEVVVLASTAATTDDKHLAERELFVTIAPGQLQYDKLGALAPHVASRSRKDAAYTAKTISLRSAHISLDTIFRESKVSAPVNVSCLTSFCLICLPVCSHETQPLVCHIS